jgi:hypothetical protein
VIGVYKNVRKYLRDGDFWSLLPAPEDQTGWDAWQFHDPDTHTGLLVLFKRRDCDEASVTVQPRWPEHWRQMHYTSLLGEATATVADDGLRVDVPGRAVLLRYDRRMPAPTKPS